MAFTNLFAGSKILVHGRRILLMDLHRKIFVIIFIAIPLSSFGYSISIENIYKKQLELQNEMQTNQIDLIARISYAGDVARAKAETNYWDCGKYLISMKDYGHTGKLDKNLSETEMFFQARFEKCMALYSIFRYLPSAVKYKYFKEYPEKLDGIGDSPYEDIWRSISANETYTKIIEKFIDKNLYNYKKCILTSEKDKLDSCEME